MLPGHTSYPEGQFKPEGRQGCWFVWCITGALQVLKAMEHISYTRDNPGKSFIVSFANGAAARITPKDELWRALREIAKTHRVEVFPLSLAAKYVAWTGADGDISSFDAISITSK